MFYGGDGPGGRIDYPAYEILNVPGRSQIKIHKGNKATDVQGCVALGKDLGALDGAWCVVGSREAFSEFMTAAAIIDPHEITITWAEPEQ
jgi:hypothetical protein